MAKLKIGKNDLQSYCIENNLEYLLKEWHPTKNGDLKPTDVTAGSGLKVWWLLPYDDSKTDKHFDFEWEATIANRIKGSGCPYCSNPPKKIYVGFNDFETWCKQNNKQYMLDEWNYIKNKVTPSDVFYGTGKKYWWIDSECHHSYEASLNKRTSDETGCPYCCKSHTKLLDGVNDLATTNPDLLKYWDYNNNENLLPTMVMRGQNKKVWWKGECGHSWQSSISHFVNGNRCPICRKQNQTSFPEQAIYYYIKSVYPDAMIDNRDVLNGKEIDIFIPSKSIGIEFDGGNWHTDISKDIIKNNLCRDNNITLYRIRDTDCPKLDASEGVFIINHETYTDECLKKCILELFCLLNHIVDVDLDRDRNLIYAQYLTQKKEKSLSFLFPQIAKEWDYEKNVKLTPDMVTSMSDKKVWWKGECGHSWQAVIHTRTKQGTGCPYCNGNKFLQGFNDLETTHPKLLMYWDYDKNDILPNSVTATLQKKVWWKCDICNSSYLQPIANKVNNPKCPICVNAQYNRASYSKMNKTIDITHQEFLKEWDYNKNDILPNEITAGSDKKVWWRCCKNHSYQTSVSNRIGLNRGCPYCNNRKVLIGFNDLATTHPQLAAEWHPTKNGDLKPADVTVGSSKKKVWWYLPYDDPKTGKHFDFEWETRICHRVNGCGCPYLLNKQVWAGFNDLATTHPKLAAQWHPTKNGNLKPTDVYAKSNKEVWWINENGEKLYLSPAKMIKRL